MLNDSNLKLKDLKPKLGEPSSGDKLWKKPWQKSLETKLQKQSSRSIKSKAQGKQSTQVLNKCFNVFNNNFYGGLSGYEEEKALNNINDSNNNNNTVNNKSTNGCIFEFRRETEVSGGGAGKGQRPFGRTNLGRDRRCGVANLCTDDCLPASGLERRVSRVAGEWHVT